MTTLPTTVLSGIILAAIPTLYVANEKTVDPAGTQNREILTSGVLTSEVASDEAATDKAAKGKRTTVLAAGDHDVSALVSALAKLMSCNIVSSPVELSSIENKITLQSDVELKTDNAWSVIENLLYIRNLHIVPLDPDQKLYEVINATGPARGRIQTQATNMSVDEVLNNRHRKLQVLCTIQLQHARATSATNVLRPFFTSSGSIINLTIGNIGTDHSLILMGSAHQVAAAVEMIRKVDVAPNPNIKTASNQREVELTKRLAIIEARLNALESK